MVLVISSRLAVVGSNRAWHNNNNNNNNNNDNEASTAGSLEEKQRWQAADHMECTYPAMDQQDEIYTYSQDHQRKGRSYPWFLEWHCNATTWSLSLSLCPHLITMVSCSFAYTNLLVLTWWCYVAALYLEAYLRPIFFCCLLPTYLVVVLCYVLVC